MKTNVIGKIAKPQNTIKSILRNLIPPRATLKIQNRILVLYHNTIGKTNIDKKLISVLLFKSLLK